MGQENSFHKLVLKIAVPVTLQSLLQSSFSVIDQIMTGQLGSTSIAGIGLGGKFYSIFSVLVSAIAAVAGIMIAQYMGKKDDREVSRSFFVNVIMALFLAVLFTGMCLIFPSQIMGAYTKDAMTREVAAGYLRIIAVSYIPVAVGTLLSTLLRCMNAAVIPLYASILAAVINTGLNYVLIFGKLGFPGLGVTGAAVATVISQSISCILILGLFLWYYRRQELRLNFVFHMNKSCRIQYLGILLPILVCEFLWSLGENVYAAIYGHIGTDACAAMTLTSPVQVLVIGALSGLSQAAAILIGKSLGSEEYEKAYANAKKLMLYGLLGAVMLSLVLMFVNFPMIEAKFSSGILHLVLKTSHIVAETSLLALRQFGSIKELSRPPNTSARTSPYLFWKSLTSLSKAPAKFRGLKSSGFICPRRFCSPARSPKPEQVLIPVV